MNRLLKLAIMEKSREPFGTPVASEQTVPGILGPTMTRLTDTDWAFYDHGNNELRRYTFDGATISLVGTGLGVAGRSGSLCAQSDTRVTLATNRNDGELRTFDDAGGGSWSQINATFTTTGTTTNNELGAVDADEITMLSADQDEFRKFSWDGSQWSLDFSDPALVGSLLWINRPFDEVDDFVVVRNDGGTYKLNSIFVNVSFTPGLSETAHSTALKLGALDSNARASGVRNQVVAAYRDSANKAQVSKFKYDGTTYNEISRIEIDGTAFASQIAMCQLTDTLAMICYSDGTGYRFLPIAV